MDEVEDLEVDVCINNIEDESKEQHDNVEKSDDQNKTPNKKSVYLTASELFNLRRDFCKNKGKDEDVEIYKGQKLYAPSNSTEEEILSGIYMHFKKSLSLQRGAKMRDCMKAEWNEELNIATVYQLKGKITQHMGQNCQGKTVLSPEEALFLLEKNCIEILHNNLPMSIEEGYAVMLKGKLALEKYQVYSNLSQQGFIVVPHQHRSIKKSDITSSKKLSERKRPATNSSTEEPEAKRTSFCGILTSNQQVVTKVEEIDFSVSAITSTLFSDSEVLSSDSVNKSNSVIKDTVITGDVSSNLSDLNRPPELVSIQDKAPSPDSTNHIDLSNLREKDLSEKTDMVIDLKDTDSEVSKSDTQVCLDKNGEANIMDTSISLGKICEANVTGTLVCLDKGGEPNILDTSISFDKISVINVTDPLVCLDKNENLSKNDGNVTISPDKSCDTNLKDTPICSEKNQVEISDADKLTNSIIEKDKPTNKDTVQEDINVINNEKVENISDSNDIIVEVEHKSEDDIIVESSSSEYEDEYTDESMPVVCDESSVEESLDVMSCSTSDPGGTYDGLTSQSNDVYDDLLKEADDEVTLVEVKKKESLPLAVIDLLSDDEQGAEQNNENDTFEGSDDDIQIVKVCAGVKNYPKPGSGNTNSIKKECKKEIKSNINIKETFHRQLKFPKMYKKDLLCLQRPPVNYLPYSVRPVKEAYVINMKRPTQASAPARVWNSWKDMQNYQRDQRLARQVNNDRPFNSLRDFRFQSESNPLRGNALIQQDNPQGFNCDRNNQNFAHEQNRSFNSPLPHQDPRPTLLPSPSPSVFNLPAQCTPFMNTPNMLNVPNPANVLNELQRTMYSMAHNMLSSMIGQHMNPMNQAALPNPAYNVPQNQYNNYSSLSPMIPQNTGFNSDFRSGIHLPEFESQPVFSEERFPHTVDRGTMFEMNRRQNSFNQRHHERKGPLFPCHYRQVRKKRSWNDVQSAVSAVADKKSDSGSDIEEIPINLNQFLFSTNIQPAVKPGSRLPVVEVFRNLSSTQMAGFLDSKRNFDRCLPDTPSLEISFDVYLPGFKYKKTAPDIPKRRIVVSRSDEPIAYSELVVLKRKFCDGAVLQVAVVDHGDISFFCYNSSCIPEMVPHEN